MSNEILFFFHQDVCQTLLRDSQIQECRVVSTGNDITIKEVSRSTDPTAATVASSTVNQDDNTDLEAWKIVSFEVIPEKIEMLRKRLVILPSSFFHTFSCLLQI